MSLLCTVCGGSLERAPRTWLERLAAARVFACSACRARARVWRVLPFVSIVRFLSSRTSQCIQCGGSRVRSLAVRDGLDRTSRHPISLLLSLVCAPICHCNMCRLQYRDWRPVRSPHIVTAPDRVPQFDPSLAVESVELQHQEALSA
jgi:hypothetical protein